MLVTAWLSSTTTSAQGADPNAPGYGAESQTVKPQTPESQSLKLRFDDGLLSLHSSQRPYTEVLGAIQKETGIRFHYTIPMSGTVTLSFKDVPVQEALKRLLGRDAQLMFRFPEGSSTASHAGVPEEVWILGTVSGPIPEAGGSQDKPATSVSDGSDAAAHSTDTTSPADEPQPEADQATSEQSHMDSVMKATESKNPNLRLQALSALAASDNADQETVNAALDAALRDPDAGVRAQAFQALVTRGGPEAKAYLEQALRDKDPGVRITALDRVVPAEHGTALLEQALSDADPAVRAIADAKLHPEAPRRRAQ